MMWIAQWHKHSLMMTMPHSSEILNSLQPAGSQSWVHGSRDGTDLAKLQGVHLRRHFGRLWWGVVWHKDGRKLRYSNIFEKKNIHKVRARDWNVSKCFELLECEYLCEIRLGSIYWFYWVHFLSKHQEWEEWNATKIYRTSNLLPPCMVATPPKHLLPLCMFFLPGGCPLGCQMVSTCWLHQIHLPWLGKAGRAGISWDFERGISTNLSLNWLFNAGFRSSSILRYCKIYQNWKLLENKIGIQWG